MIAAGLDRGYDLSGIAEGYALKDTNQGNGIVYDAHKYPWKTLYSTSKEEAVDVVNDEHPILIGEFGVFEDEEIVDHEKWVPYKIRIFNTGPE